MNDEADQKIILDFLTKTPLAVISTLDAQTQRPEAALVAFAELPTLELIFETQTTSRKYQNLLKNSAVALVMGWNPEKHITLQYEGHAAFVPKKDIPFYRNLLLQKETPCTEEFLLHPEAQLFSISPVWIRYSDYTSPHPTIIELSYDRVSIV